ncbi:hypothetical protein ACIBL8_41390 [Streptomyces sp. NPDC050523]|uniref:hypothetical protein n=1 Tax=Streptomyces sp. NPDC050523 TaxID=3365622 RepID=UPI0037A8408B
MYSVTATPAIVSAVVDDLAAAGFRKAPQGWHHHGKACHPLDVQDLAVFGLKARQAKPTQRAVDDVRRELARDWPVAVPVDQALAPTSSTLAMEAALMIWRFSLYTLRQDDAGWSMDGQPLLFHQVRKLAAGWAVVVAEAHGMPADHAPEPRKVLNDLRRLVRDAEPR